MEKAENKTADKAKTKSIINNPFVVGLGVVLVLCAGIVIGKYLSIANGVVSADSQLISLQGNTLTITGLAIALVSILTALHNYDYEQKAEKWEDQLRQEHQAISDNFSKSQTEYTNTIKRLNEISEEQKRNIEKANESIRSNIEVLFDVNSRDDIHTVLRVELYREKLRKSQVNNEDGENYNVALALIDDLAFRAANETNEKQIKDNDEIISLVDRFLPTLEEGSFEWINFQVKKANADFHNAQLLVDTIAPDDNEKAEKYITDGINILLMLKKHDKVPKILDDYLENYLGLYYFWKYKITKCEADIDESIGYYDRIKPVRKTDSKFLNNLAVARQNKARFMKDSEARIKAYREIHDIYLESIRANPQRDQGWRNVAAINRDLLHELLNISDMKKLETAKVRNDLTVEEKANAEKLYTEALDCIKKGSRLSSENYGFYYIHADLNCSMALIRREGMIQLLEDAKNSLEFALLMDRNSDTVNMAEKYLYFCVDQLIDDETVKNSLKNINRYNI